MNTKNLGTTIDEESRRCEPKPLSRSKSRASPPSGVRKTPQRDPQAALDLRIVRTPMTCKPLIGQKQRSVAFTIGSTAQIPR